MKQLLEKMERDLELKGLSKKTQKIYIHWVGKFLSHCTNALERKGNEHIKEYLHFIIHERKLSSSSVNQVYSALQFFYTHTLEKEWEFKSIPRMKKNKTLPIVLERNEIDAILKVTRNIKHRALLCLIYSAGLRLSEASQLKISDIDSKRMQIRIERAKGGKDRYTILSNAALELVREYWKIYRPVHWLFVGSDPRKPISGRTIQKVFENSKTKAGINKSVTVHSLRHSFATHLLENGVGLHHIQLLLGHSSPQTTTIYLHLKRSDLVKIESPLDNHYRSLK